MTRVRAGIKEIAEASGVSQATVSQVLGGGKRPVRVETRARVEQAARALGYRPSAVARGLAGKRMDTLGVVIHHDLQAAHTNPALAAILDGILSTATRRHQHANIVTYSCWEEAEARLPALTDGRCDGVLLVVPPRRTALVPALLDCGLPFVLIGAHSDDPRVSCVDIDNVAAAETVVAHLLAQGHRRIALFSGNPTALEFVDERVRGYRRALAAAGLPFDPALVVTGGRVSEDLAPLLERPARRPTALFCVTDADALSTMQFLPHRGLRVPDDLSVAGFDDVPQAAQAFPPLTTLRQPSAAAGGRAADLLLAQINGEQPPGAKVCLHTELVVRRSDAPAPCGLQRA